MESCVLVSNLSPLLPIYVRLSEQETNFVFLENKVTHAKEDSIGCGVPVHQTAQNMLLQYNKGWNILNSKPQRGLLSSSFY
jgi:hypothetical protein